MEITRQEYKFSRSGGMVERGQHSYGSNSCVRDCPDCYGGGHRGLLKCNNCKGTGKVENVKDQKWECMDCGEKWMPRSTPNRCPECGSSHIEEDE